MTDDSAPDPEPGRAAPLELRARVAPAPTASLDWRSRFAVWVIARATGDEAPHVFTTFARHPRLFRRWLPFAGWLLLRTELPRREVELVVLRTAWNAGSAYEWTQHVPLARKAGLDAGTIDAIPEWNASPSWTPRWRALLQATDELHEHRVITDRTWSELEAQLTEHERTELCFVVGHYEMVAMTLNSLGVECEAGASARLDASTAGVAAATSQRLGRLRTDRASG